MARAIWSGTLGFGLVSVPVELYSATVDRTIHFNQFEAGTSDRIRNKRVNERTGEDVDYADIVKGYDLGGGEYVLLSPEELEAVEPGRSRTIEVLDFVDSDEIDPIFYRKTYYLVPKGEAAVRAYALLRRAMQEARKVGVAMFVMRAKQYLVAVRPEDEVLALEAMFFADEIVDPRQEIAGLPLPEVDFTGREVETAKMLVDSMASEWDPGAYRDTYREAVEELVARKRQGEEVVTESVREQPAPVVNLLEALSASVEAARTRQRAGADDASSTRPSRAAGRARGGSRSTRPARDEGRRSTSGGGRRGSRQRGGSPAPASKSALYEQASALGIAGRSKMSREELEAAVRRAAARQRRAS